MAEYKKRNNNLDNILYECPRCHIKLNKKEMNLHNIKCRKMNNQIERIKIDLTKEETEKDEYKDFMEKIPKINFDEKNIKSFILILGKKIESLENIIYNINDKIKKLNNINSLYFQQICDSLDNINKRYKNKREEIKPRLNNNTINNFQNMPIINRNETDLNIIESKMSNKIKKIPSPFNIGEEKWENKNKTIGNYFYSRCLEKKQNMSEKDILNNNKEKNQYNEKTFDNNKNYKDAIKREKKKENKYKIKQLKINSNFNNNNYYISNKYNSLNFLTEGNIIDNVPNNNNNTNRNMRHSLSSGNFTNTTKNDNKLVNNENEENINYDNDNILIGSLDLIMEKISNLEETLLNIGYDDKNLREKIFSLKSKDFEYSNSESYHSDASGDI